MLLYFVIPRKVKYLWLLAASYYFYMGWNAKYALLIAFSTVVTWLSGLLFGMCQKPGQDGPEQKKEGRNCPSRFWDRSIGPATNCGKKETNNAYFNKFFSGFIFSRYTSIV